MKKLYKNKFDKQRRDFLKILSSAGISRALLKASPLVGGMMMSRLAEAQNGPDKSVIIYCPDGAIPDLWFPNNNLSSFPVMSQPYSSVASDCNFLRNMGHHRGGHGVMSTLINDRWVGDSFDVNMGRVLGGNTPFTYVNLGVHSNGHGYLTRDNGAEVAFEDNPFNAFDRLFGNLPSGGGGGSEGASKGSVIDAHKDALSALGNKLGTYEQHRLDSHLTAIEETEARIASLSGGTISCDSGTPPASFELEHATFEQQAHLQADIITMALECNLTSSCSLALGNHQGEFAFPYLGFDGIYHQSIHGGNAGDPNYPHFSETRSHMSSLSAYLIQSLKNAGILDTTIVCEVTDMGDGDGHGSNNIPLVMAGGGGAIQRGVSNAGGSSYTPLNMIHTAAVALGADQHPDYQGYADSVIPGVLT
ncbi:DUF1552 domain-containing protein [Teredinibacter purpureus]|uniref:DUF1552 domain-containing protein n=1 Tax=Teredinibacter purpureus TaxID=2731756 RepID=UPI000A9695CA|nr:DUF1552 domain-containing protein [Teredinibacter purpureus]